MEYATRIVARLETAVKKQEAGFEIIGPIFDSSLTLPGSVFNKRIEPFVKLVTVSLASIGTHGTAEVFSKLICFAIWCPKYSSQFQDELGEVRAEMRACLHQVKICMMLSIDLHK
jgi:hypothetical protein